jgi:hypothetical protein
MSDNNSGGDSKFWAMFFLICVVVFGFYNGWFGLSSDGDATPSELPPMSMMDDALDVFATVEYVATTQSPSTTEVAPMMPASVPPATKPTAVSVQPTRDWTPELTAVNRNVQNAIDLVENCAIEKAKAATEFRVLDCQPVISNLEAAKQKQQELQETISANN